MIEASNVEASDRLLFVGELPQRSSPSWTLARALRCYGFETMFSDRLERKDTQAWLDLVQQASVMIVVKYKTVDPFFLRQLALAVAAGTPMIRWWVGSDVMPPLRCPDERRFSLQIQRISNLQLTVSPHLVEELETVGIHAHYIPSVLDPGPPAQILDHVPKSLLVYLPGHRREFYGASIVREAAEAFPDVEFVVVADDLHHWADLPNVECLGWVSEMDPVWNRVGGVLRVTHHDGMPRMVLDGLRRGKHVMYSWPFPGCRLTRSFPEVRGAIEDFRATNTINQAGITAYESVMDPTPEARFAEAIATAICARNYRRRVSAASVVAGQSIRVKMHGLGLNGRAKPALKSDPMSAPHASSEVI